MAAERPDARPRRARSASGIVNVTDDSMFEGARSGTPERRDRGRPARWPRRASRCSTSAPWRRAAGRRCRPRRRPSGWSPRSRASPRAPSCRSRPTPSPPRSPARALEAGAVAINDIGGGSEPAMLELAAEIGLRPGAHAHRGTAARGPRAAALRRPGRSPEGLVRRRGSRPPSKRGVDEEQIALDPGLDFDLSVADDLEVLRRLGELKELGRPLYVSLSRKDFLGAVLAGSWEERAAGRAIASGRPPRPWRWRSTAGADLLRLHDRERAAGDADRRGDRGAAGGSRLASRAAVAGRRLGAGAGPGARGRAPGRRVRRGGDDGEAHRAARVAPPGARRGASGGRDRVALLAPGRRLRDRPRLPPDPDQRHRLREVALLQPARCSTGSRDEPKRRALYLYPTKALAQDQARKLGELRPPGLREAIYDGDTPREDRPSIRRRANLVLTNPDMLNVGVLPHHKRWGDFLANLGWVVVDEAHTYRGVFGSHVANVLRRLRRVARLYGAEPRFVLASATIANPRRARRAAHRAADFELLDDDGAPRAGPRDRDVEPAGDRAADDDAALAGLRGGRPARRAGLARGADDLLHAQPPRHRADQPVRLGRAGAAGAGRAGRADRALPGRLHAAAAPRDRGAARLGRPARGRRHRRARARDRRRRARRGDLRQLPRHGRQPAPDVGPRRPAPPRPRRLRRGRGRARPVLLPPSRTSSSSGRSRRRSSTTAPSRSRCSTCSRPPTRRRSARTTTRSSARAGASAPSGW